MSVVWPEKFTPQGIGQPTKLDLPGVATRSALQIATIAQGVSVTRSRFLEAEGRIDDIKRQADTLLVVVGLTGTTDLQCLASGEKAQVNAGEFWLLHPRAEGIRRKIAPNLETSSFVVSIRQSEVSPNLSAATQKFADAKCVFAKVTPEVFEPEEMGRLFDQELSGPALLQVEARCMTLIAGVLSAFENEKTPSLRDNLCRYLNANLGEKIALEVVARHVGMNRTKLNEKLRQECGQTVFELLRELRVKRAQDIIEKQNKPLSQVAYETGFSSASHLCRALKSYP